MKRSPTVACALIALLGLASVATAAVENEEYGRTPPRLSFYDGEVSFWRPGADDWAPARINLPLSPGDALYTDAAANLELQVGTLAFIRAGELTQLTLANQESDFLQITLSTGHLAVDVRGQPSGKVIEIDTPGAAIVIDRAGYYRFRVTDQRTTVVTRRGGRATLTPANGEPRVISGNQRATVDSRDRVAIDEAPDPDVWDRWNYDRTDEVADSSSGRYVPPGVYGAEDLDRYGSWRNVPTYGWVWAPSVDPAWVPYSTGSWVWDSYYGWTWVDDAPWGWAPAHYGRWVYTNNYWAWAPGPVVVSPFYAPAVVAFFGGGVSVGVGFGAPYVSWVALGWGEPLYPWWGGVGFYGYPCWYGWGGPRWHHHDDDHHDGHGGHNGHGDHDGHGGYGGHDGNGDHNGGHNDHGPNDYQNAKVQNAILAADKSHFGRGPVSGTRVPSDQARNLAPVSAAAVKPVAASMAPQQGAAVRPPSAALSKPVVATRPAHDPSAALQAAGLPSSAPASAPRHAARVVSAPPQAAPRSAPVGRTDSIDRSPVSAPRSVDAPESAPGQAPAVGGRPRSATVNSPNVDRNAPASAPRSAPADHGSAPPPMSAPRQQERDGGGVHSAPSQVPPPVHRSHNAPASAPHSSSRVQPPAPPQSAPQQGRHEGAGSSAPRQRYEAPPPHSAPRQAAPGDSGSVPMSAPRSMPRSESMPQSAPRIESAPPSGGSPYSGPAGGGSGYRGGGSSVGGGGGAPRSSSGPVGGGSSSGGGATRGGGGGGGGGVGSGPRD